MLQPKNDNSEIGRNDIFGVTPVFHAFFGGRHFLKEDSGFYLKNDRKLENEDEIFLKFYQSVQNERDEILQKT